MCFFLMVEANKLEGSSNYVVWKVKMKVLPQRRTLQHCLSSYNWSCTLNCVDFNCYHISNAEQYHFVGLKGLWICDIVSICQRWNYILYCWSRWSNQLLENFQNLFEPKILLEHYSYWTSTTFYAWRNVFDCWIYVQHQRTITLLGTIGELCKKRQ